MVNETKECDVPGGDDGGESLAAFEPEQKPSKSKRSCPEESGLGSPKEVRKISLKGSW